MVNILKSISHYLYLTTPISEHFVNLKYSTICNFDVEFGKNNDERSLKSLY